MGAVCSNPGEHCQSLWHSTLMNKNKNDFFQMINPPRFKHDESFKPLVLKHVHLLKPPELKYNQWTKPARLKHDQSTTPNDSNTKN